MSDSAAVAGALLGAERILVVSHYNPDADAYGSACGLAAGLASVGKSVVTANQDGAVARFGFIPGVAAVARPSELSGTFDVVAVCDCGSRDRAGEEVTPFLDRASVVANVDHHSSNDRFGHVNLVEPHASSTSELVYGLFGDLGATFSADSATCLLAGIIGDTGSFRYESTSPRTFRAAADLASAGAVASRIAAGLFSGVPVRAVRLQAAAMTGLELLFDGTVAVVTVTDEMYRRFGAGPDDTDPLVERARDVEGVRVSALIRPHGDLLRVSLRSVGASFDVSAVAARFGGGGHRAAAAFRYRGDAASLEAALLPMLGAVAAGGLP